MQKLVKKLRKAVRGLTFTLSAMEPGDHFRYFINTKKNEVRIIRDDEGKIPYPARNQAQATRP